MSSDTEEYAKGSVYYYPGNKILVPEWAKSEARTGPTRRWLWVVVPIVLLILAGLAWGWYQSNNLRNATVLVLSDTNNNNRIDEGDRQGSGVLIGSKGYVLTARHVLMDPGETQGGMVEIWYNSGSENCEHLSGTFVEAGEPYHGSNPLEIMRRNWAIIQVNRTEPFPRMASSKRRDFSEGKAIKVTGFPLGFEIETSSNGPSVKMASGELTRVDRGEQGAVVRLTHDVDITHGHSGGPLIDPGILGLNPKLIGVNLQMHEATHAAENYALPTYLLEEEVFKNYAD